MLKIVVRPPSASFWLITLTGPSYLVALGPGLSLTELLGYCRDADRRSGWRVRIKVYGPPREHGPPHVHVERGRAGVVVIRLAIDSRPARIWQVHGLTNRDVLAAYRLVERYETEIRAMWRRLHGSETTD